MFEIKQLGLNLWFKPRRFSSEGTKNGLCSSERTNKAYELFYFKSKISNASFSSERTNTTYPVFQIEDFKSNIRKSTTWNSRFQIKDLNTVFQIEDFKY